MARDARTKAGGALDGLDAVPCRRVKQVSLIPGRLLINPHSLVIVSRVWLQQKIFFSFLFFSFCWHIWNDGQDQESDEILDGCLSVSSLLCTSYHIWTRASRAYSPPFRRDRQGSDRITQYSKKQGYCEPVKRLTGFIKRFLPPNFPHLHLPKQYIRASHHMSPCDTPFTRR